MTPVMPMLLAALTLASVLGPVQATPSQPPKTPPTQRAPTTSAKKSVNPNDTHADTIKDFLKRVDDYVVLRKKLEATLPALPKQTDPKAIDQHERALAKLIQEQRKTAKQGDIFTVPMQTVVRRLMAPVFTGKEGAHVKSEILDNEFKGSVVVTPNGRYPDEIPVSTVPPQVLQNLPKLPEELEYRFVRQNLILFDPHAHIIPDWVPQAFK
jgi:hypothetical protein